jgi:hypothetical protein
VADWVRLLNRTFQRLQDALCALGDEQLSFLMLIFLYYSLLGYGRNHLYLLKFLENLKDALRRIDMSVPSH